MKDIKNIYLKWGNFNSKDSENPDVVEFKVLEIETFDTEYSTNIKIQQNTDKQWNEVILPLKSHSSNNLKLLNLWNDAVKSKKIRSGTKFKLKTWLGVSKNDRTIRRFEIAF